MQDQYACELQPADTRFPGPLIRPMHLPHAIPLLESTACLPTAEEVRAEHFTAGLDLEYLKNYRLQHRRNEGFSSCGVKADIGHNRQ